MDAVKNLFMLRLAMVDTATDANVEFLAIIRPWIQVICIRRRDYGQSFVLNVPSRVQRAEYSGINVCWQGQVLRSRYDPWVRF